VFRRRGWFQGRPIRGKASDVGWLTPDGVEMGEENWGEGHAKSLGVFLNGATIGAVEPRGLPVRDASFYVIFNGHHESVAFKLPGEPWGRRWELVFDTAHGFSEAGARELASGEQVVAEGRSVVLLRQAQ
jgi:isoamylase